MKLNNKLNKYTISERTFLENTINGRLKQDIKNYVKPEFAGCYLIHNIKTNKIYIGSSQNIWRRWLNHRTELKHNRHHCIYLQRAWNKYFPEDFEFKVIEIIIQLDNEEYSDFKQRIKDRENYYFKFYNIENKSKCYNLSNIAGVSHNLMTEEDIKNNKTLYNWNKYLEAKKLLCETNMQFIQIENETGISRSFLESIYHRRLLIKEYKNICFPIRSRKLKDIISEEDKEKLMDMLKQGKTISEIQEVFHIGHDGVKIILDSLGINRKDIEGAIQQKHPVYQYDLLGNFIKRYSSIKEAWQEMGLKNGASIGNCCTGRINSIKGFKWFFTPQENIIITKYDKICYITGRTHNNMYSIIQYNQNYKPIKFLLVLNH